MSKQVILISLGISILINIVVVVFIFSSQKKEDQQTPNLRQRYSFLSPRIFTENQNDRLINFVALRHQLTKYYEEENADMGIYFEYLPSGVSIGVNDRANYIQASLLKMPLIMGTYRQLEKGVINKNDIVTIKKQDIDSLFGDLWKRGEGTELTIDEAIKYTLIHSDNTAKNVIFSSVPEGTLEDVFDSLDIPKELEGNDPVVTPKNYSSILRSLYLSSYLHEESSNEILNLLTETPFNDKLAAGVPSNIKVAHKIGVHLGGNDLDAVFTDCGIIYVPKRPYILCIMVNEKEEDARKHMTEVSRIVYDYVSGVNYEQKP